MIGDVAPYAIRRFDEYQVVMFDAPCVQDGHPLTVPGTHAVLLFDRPMFGSLLAPALVPAVDKNTEIM